MGLYLKIKENDFGIRNSKFFAIERQFLNFDNCSIFFFLCKISFY